MPPHIHIAVRQFATMDTGAMAALLTAEDYEQLSSRAEPRRRQLLGRACRRALLAAAVDTDPMRLVFAQAPGGKPFLLEHALSFSIAHSRTALALAWSRDDIRLGIDIEDRARRARMAEIANSTFSPAEIAAWDAAGRDRSFWLAIWTRKEALLKCNGLGLRIPLVELDTCSTDDQGHLHHGRLGQLALQSWALPQHLLSLAWPARAPARITLDCCAAQVLPATLQADPGQA